jgi:hypothetical protein
MFIRVALTMWLLLGFFSEIATGFLQKDKAYIISGVVDFLALAYLLRT